MSISVRLASHLPGLVFAASRRGILPAWVWSLAVAAGVLLTAVAARGANLHPATVTIGAVGGIAPLNPVTTSTTVAVNVFDVLFDRLVTEDGTGQPAPGLAESWQASADGRTWEFALRPDARFHDGEPVTAADVAFTLDLLRRDHPGVDPVLLAIDTVQVLTPTAVRLRLARASASSFLYHLRQPVLPKHVLSPQVAAGLPLADLPFGRDPVGSGPYRFAGWRTADQLLLAANPGHWNGRPGMDTVVVRADYQDTQAMWSGLMRGEVDVAPFSSQEDQLGLGTDRRIRIIDGLGPTWFGLHLNCRTYSLLADCRLRQALACAIDRRAIWRLLGGSASVPDSLVVPPGPFAAPALLSGSGVPAWRLDRKQADSLLTAAGWMVDSTGGRRKQGQTLELRLAIPLEFPSHQGVATQLRQDLDDLGIRLRVFALPYVDRLPAADSLDLLWSGGRYWFDVAVCVSPWRRDNPQNWSGYTSNEAERLIELVQSARSPGDAERTCRQLQWVLAVDVPTVFVCRGPLSYAVRGNLIGTETLAHVGLFRSLPAWHWGQPTND